MLNGFIASRLAKYVKGCSREKVSSSLFDGKLSLADAELDLAALDDVLVGVLPYTLSLQRVALKAIKVKVPWQNPRRHPISVVVGDCTVEVVVHRQKDKEWLAVQTEAQHRALLRGAMRSAAETLKDDEEEEDRREQRGVEASLRVGLQNVVADGLHFTLSNLSLVILSADDVHFHNYEPPASTAPSSPMPLTPAGSPLPTSMPLPRALPRPLLALRLASLTALPCTRQGATIHRPEDAFEVCDTAVFSRRAVEVSGLRLEGVAVQATEPRPPGTATAGSASWLPILEHDDAGGVLRVNIEQKRLSGFIPKHRSRRVCPFPSEAVIEVVLGRLSLNGTPERQLLRLAAVAADAASPAFVPLAALPDDLRHLHWRAALPQDGGTGSDTAAASPTATTPASAPASPAAAAAAPRPPQTDSGVWPAPSVARRPDGQQGQSPPTERGAAAAAPLADGVRWSEAVPAGGVCAGLERREQLADLRLTRLVSLRLTLREACAELRVAARPAAVVVRAEGVAFGRDLVLALDAFERRCLAELGLAAPAAAAAGARPTAEADGGGGCDTAIASAAAPGTGCAPAEPVVRLPLLCLNGVDVAGATAWLRPAANFGAAAGTFGDVQLLQLQVAPAGGARARAALTFRWKEIPPAPVDAQASIVTVDAGWQPVEGCIHGASVVLDIPSWQTVGLFAKRIADVALEHFVPPPLEIGWLRIAVHDVELEVPKAAGLAMAAAAPLPPMRAAIPALLLTSVPGTGQLFCALEAVPMTLTKTPRSSAPKAEALDGEAAQMCGFACPCGRELLSGALKVSNGFRPACSRTSARGELLSRLLASNGNSGSAAERVLVSHREFVDLVQSQISGTSLAAVLPELAALFGAAGGASEAPSASPSSSPSGKRSTMGKLSSSVKRGLGLKKAGSSTPQRTSSEAAAAQADKAKQWGTLHDRVRRLRAQREEVFLRCAALRETAAAAVTAAEAEATEAEVSLTRQIEEQRALQAQLSARLVEQHEELSQLLRNTPGT